jgi:hypothetical protein
MCSAIAIAAVIFQRLLSPHKRHRSNYVSPQLFLSSFMHVNKHSLLLRHCMRVANMSDAGADVEEVLAAPTTQIIVKAYCPVLDESCECPRKTGQPFRGKTVDILQEKVRCHLVNSPYHYLKTPEATSLVEAMDYEAEEEEITPYEPPAASSGKSKEGKGGKGKGKGKNHGNGPYANHAIVPRDARCVAYDPAMAAADRSRLYGIASAIADNLARAESAFAAACRVAQAAATSMNQEAENVANARREIEKVMRQL